jgi:uracil-DNA glycosylase
VSDLKRIRRIIGHCHTCEISALCTHKVILSPKNPNRYPDLLFVGEAPGESEYICKEPFVGKAGQILREITAQLPDLTCVYTNAVLCTPFIDTDLDDIRTPSPSEVKECSRHLAKIITYLSPVHIIAVGKIAERSLKALGEKHTTILHPSNMLRSSHQELEMQRALLKIRHAISKDS